MLLLSGLQDEIVPAAHMRGLLELAAKRGEKKTSRGTGVEYKTGLERVKFLDFANGQHSTFSPFLQRKFGSDETLR